MFYKEKWENGVFYIKMTPTGDWIHKVPSIDQLEVAYLTKKITFAQALACAYVNCTKQK